MMVGMVKVRAIEGFAVDDFLDEDEDIGIYDVTKGEIFYLEEGFAKELEEEGYVEIVKE